MGALHSVNVNCFLSLPCSPSSLCRELAYKMILYSPRPAAPRPAGPPPPPHAAPRAQPPPAPAAGAPAPRRRRAGGPAELPSGLGTCAVTNTTAIVCTGLCAPVRQGLRAERSLIWHMGGAERPHRTRKSKHSGQARSERSDSSLNRLDRLRSMKDPVVFLSLTKLCWELCQACRKQRPPSEHAWKARSMARGCGWRERDERGSARSFRTRRSSAHRLESHQHVGRQQGASDLHAAEAKRGLALMKRAGLGSERPWQLRAGGACLDFTIRATWQHSCRRHHSECCATRLESCTRG